MIDRAMSLGPEGHGMAAPVIGFILVMATTSVAAGQTSPSITVRASHWGLGNTCDDTVVIARLCNGRTECIIDEAKHDMCPGGTDPAPGQFKVLDTIYTCSSDGSRRKTIRFASAPNKLKAVLSCP